MYRICILFIAPLLTGLFPVSAFAMNQELKSYSLTQLEQRLTAIDSELDQLAEITLRSGVGNLGWQSKTQENPTHREWAEINLGHDQSVDQIVLVPLLWRDTKRGVQADGFPIEFRIIAGKQGDRKGSVIAAFSEEDDALLPRIAPLIIPIEATTAAWIRVEATKLTPRAMDGRYSLRFSEMLVFSGEENMALQRPVTVSSSSRTIVQTKNPTKALVDGFTPYVLNAAQGEKSPDFCCFFFKDDPFSFSLDLGESLPLNRIHLHAADRQETVPHLQHADYALPKHMVVEGANKADFSDAVTLTEYRRTTIYDACSIIPLQFPETTCRHVRLRFIDAYKAPEAKDPHRCIGFTEIELFSRNKNVALGKRFQQIGKMNFSEGTPEALTDGRNHYGNILPMKTWLNELALRHALEAEHPIIKAELNKRYARQKTNLKRMTWLAALLTTGIILFVWMEWYFHRRQVRRIKERFAADLHDELGANLHTIGLLSDMAEEAKASPENLSDYLQRIRAVTERSGFAVRHVTDLNESTELFSGLKADMQRAAERIVDKLEHDLLIEGEEYLQKIKLRTRIDLFLFYKECLINICRHSGATQLSTHLVITPKGISLNITDNGHGLPDSMKNGIPKSLSRRARLLRAKVSVNNPPEGGTQINLMLRSFWRLRIFKG